MLTVLPAASFENYFIPENLPVNIYGTMISNFLFVGFIEEFLKLIVGYYVVKTLLTENRNANTYIFLLFASGIGFSFMENIIYVYNSGLNTALLRSVSSIPMHGATAIVIGYFGYLEYNHKVKKGWLIGLVIAIIMHGIYNTYAVEMDYAIWFYGIFVITFIYVVISASILFIHRRGKQSEDHKVEENIQEEVNLTLED
jgi:RsiW-degrading membrane proteinase PrsW (M82 family)